MITENVMAVAFSAVVLFVSPVFSIYTVLMYGTRVPVHTIHATHATNMERGFPNLSTKAIHYTEKLVFVPGEDRTRDFGLIRPAL